MDQKMDFGTTPRQRRGRGFDEDDAETMIHLSLDFVRGSNGLDGLSAAIAIDREMAPGHGEEPATEFTLTWNGVFLSWVPASMIGKVDPYGNTFEQVNEPIGAFAEIKED